MKKTTEDFKDFVERVYGIKITPWQEEMMTQIHTGRKILYHRARSAGMTTLFKAYKEYLNEQVPNNNR